MGIVEECRLVLLLPSGTDWGQGRKQSRQLCRRQRARGPDGVCHHGKLVLVDEALQFSGPLEESLLSTGVVNR
jgi:hypothetical protein